MTLTPTPSDTEATTAETADADVFVLGGGVVGATIARRLEEDGHAVLLVDGSHEPPDVPVFRADPTDVNALLRVGIERASTVIVATRSDSRNLLAAQHVRTRFDPDRVIVLTNHPDRFDSMADTGHEPVCATSALADAIVTNL